MNNIALRLTGESRRSDINPSATRCALLGNCFCRRNSDCGPTQICTTLRGYGNYRVCKTKNEKVSVVKSVLPPVRRLVRYLDVDVPKLAADVLSKC